MLALFLIICASILFGLYLKQDATAIKNLEAPQAAPVQEKNDKTVWIFQVIYPEQAASQAAVVLTKLTEEGYLVRATGSAITEQKTTVLRVKPEMKEETDLLIQDLAKFLKITTVTTDFVSDTANVQLILNQE
jgi:hypothetical protein